jgi:hypothetical protein
MNPTERTNPKVERPHCASLRGVTDQGQDSQWRNELVATPGATIGDSLTHDSVMTWQGPPSCMDTTTSAHYLQNQNLSLAQGFLLGGAKPPFFFPTHPPELELESPQVFDQRSDSSLYIKERSN